jgi:hypothetical protein
MFGFAKKPLIVLFLFLFASPAFAVRMGLINSEGDGTPNNVYAYKIIWPNGTISITDGVLTYTPAAGSGSGDLLADGTVPLTANWDVGGYYIRAKGLYTDNGDTSAGIIRVFEDSDNGTSYGDISGPDQITAPRTWTFPDDSGIAFLTTAAINPSANIESFLGAADYAAARALMDLEAGTDFYSVSAADTAFEGELDNSAGLLAALSDETGTGVAVFSISPTLVTPILGTPTSGTLTNCTFPTLNQNTTGTAANLSGTPALPNGTTATTQSPADNSTKLATTAYADAAAGSPVNITPVDTGDEDATFYPVLVDGATGSQATETDSGLAYNPSTNVLTAGGFSTGGSATPTLTLKDTDDAAGTGAINANSSGGANDIILTFGVEDSIGESTPYIEVDGVSETIDLLKPVVTTGNVTVGTGIELGHASDTTIARSGAGVTTIEGETVVVESSVWAEKEVGWTVVDSDTATAVADGLQAAVIPASMNGMNLVDVTCSVAGLNSASGGTTTVVLRRVRTGTPQDMTSTGVTIDYDAYTASDETVDTSYDDVATGDLIFVDINAVTTGAAQLGLSCTAVFQTP